MRKELYSYLFSCRPLGDHFLSGLRIDTEIGRHGEYVDDTAITGKIKTLLASDDFFE